MPLPAKEYALSYRPEIDGLRAVAVLSVFIFHLNHRWLPGGFVGVDVFFVISGYLITSILFGDCNKGDFSFTRFYQRRCARIFPAFFTVALTSLGAAAFVYSPQDLSSAGLSFVAAALSLANVKYMLQGNYFDISPDAQPFLHYWSLSVEEQFYLLFPLLLFLLFKFARRRLVPIVALLGFGSFALCVVCTRRNPVYAFYLLPTRAWELSAGCILALTRMRNQDSPISSHWLPAAGILLLLASVVFIHEGPAFPGWQAAFPVLGAVAVILISPQSTSFVRKLLSSTPMVSVGKMSYSLYLWHWPVFSLVDYRFIFLTEGSRLLLKIGISFLLATASYALIENPARIFFNRPEKRRLTFAALAAVLAACIPLGLTIHSNNFINAEPSDVANGGLRFPANAGAPSVILMGDSNGSMYGKVMKEICADLGLDLTVISVAAGDALPARTGPSSKLWHDSLAVIHKTKPACIIIANQWVAKLQKDPEILELALRELSPCSARIILLNQPPIVPKRVNRQSVRNGIRPPFWEDAQMRAERLRTNQFLRRFESPGVSVVDIAQYFETNRGEVLFFDEQGRQLFHDSTHLSGHGAARIRDTLKKAIGLSLKTAY